MTTPPFNPPSGDPGGAGDATQPVNIPPAPVPPVQPGQGSAPQPAGQPSAPGFQPGATFQPGAGSFQPASPEPGPFQPVPPEPSFVVGSQAVRGPARSSRLLNVALGAAVLIAAAGISFAVGRASAPAAAASTGRFGGGFNGNLPNASFNPNGEGSNGANGGIGGFRGAFGGGFGGGLTIDGTVQSVGSDSITITTANGANVTIGLDSSTTYHQQAPGAASDVQAGKTVILQITGNGFRAGDNNGTGNNGTGNNGTGNNGTGSTRFGTASDVTVVP